MTERPILFSGAMVRTILAGQKAQTRRVVKPRYDWHVDQVPDEGGVWRDWPVFASYIYEEPDTVEVSCPYGQPGDRLWVRETFAPMASGGADYRADGDSRVIRWTPSIHMPRWASRITLEVTGVRVERLQAITEADAREEGVVQCGDGGWHMLDEDRASGNACWDDARGAFRSLWESINGPNSWAVNPWLWVVEFRRVTP